jgi:hypothetical protein
MTLALNSASFYIDCQYIEDVWHVQEVCTELNIDCERNDDLTNEQLNEQGIEAQWVVFPETAAQYAAILKLLAIQ